MRMSGRVIAVVFLATLGLCFLGLLARAGLEGMQVGTVTQSTLSMLVVTGFLIVMGFGIVASRGRIAEVAASRCTSCGAHLYSTYRPLDKRRLLTCFTCGRETAA